MRKTKLSKRDRDICSRFREAREFLGITQLSCAKQIGIERSTLTNYESGVTPIKYEVALRFCRQLIISEEWLATGKAVAMWNASTKYGYKPGADLTSLSTIFFRQCMDLLSEQICQRIPPGTLFSEAYDNFLVGRYAQLAEQFFYLPRIIFSENDKPQLAANLFSAYLERWLKLLSNESLRLKKDQWEVQRQFVRAIIEANNHIFSKFLGAKSDPTTLAALDWLKKSLTNSELKLGPLHVEEMKSVRKLESDIQVIEA